MWPRGFPSATAGERLTDMLTNLSDDALVDAIDRNCVDFFQHYGRGPGCEVHEEADLAWFVTGIPHPLFNGVMATNLAPDRVDVRIDDMVTEFRRRHLPLEWTTGSRTRPADLGLRLVAKGFEHTLDVPGMAIDRDELPEEDPPRGLVVTQAANRKDLEACVRIALNTFGISDAFVPRVVEIEEGMPRHEKELTRHYLACIDGRPIATSEVFLACGVAGLYFVGTLPDARDHGIGRAVTLSALQSAREMGYRIGVLQATEMGTPVYHRLGFRALYSMGIYVRP
jgi:GNAT superfamily N-acetyltransferase